MSFVERVEANLKGLTAVSTGPCPGCDECREHFGFDMLADMDAAIEDGSICAEPSFSSSGCGICDSALGGDLEVWHGVDSNGAILHFDDACVDCVVFLANGDVPEGEDDGDGEDDEPETPPAPFFPA
jgi:hypothetical protein